MKRLLKTVLLVTVLFIGGWTLYHRGQIKSADDFFALAQQQLMSQEWVTELAAVPSALVKFSQEAPSTDLTQQSTSRLPRPQENLLPPTNIIRLATFKFKSKQSSSREQPQKLANILARFDAVTIQDDNQSDMIQRVVHELNSNGGDYRFIDRRDKNKTFGIVFNRRTLILDQSHWYSVNDPERLMENEPLVAWFRARNAPFDQAFTFTLVNVQLNESRPDKELEYLGELFRAIRADGRGEDDIIIAGDFNCGDRGLKKIKQKGGLSWAISNTPTNTMNDAQYDNIVFNSGATIEFTGNSDVFDFLKYQNLTLVDALEISERLPVWCDFSTFEGHSPGRVYVPIDNRTRRN